VTGERERILGVIEHLRMILAILEKRGVGEKVRSVGQEIQRVEDCLMAMPDCEQSGFFLSALESALTISASMVALGKVAATTVAIQPEPSSSRADRKKFYESRNRGLVYALTNDPRWPSASRAEKAKMKLELAKANYMQLETLKKALKSGGLE